MAMIVGEHDQSFGDALAYARSSRLSGLGRLGAFAPLDFKEPKPVRIVRVVGPNGIPVPGVQLNVVDEDRETVIYGAVTDENGVAVVFVNYNSPVVSEKNRRNYIRTILLPAGYSNPVPRTTGADVSYFETKVGGFSTGSESENRLKEILKDTSKLKPDVTIKVEQTGKPERRVKLTPEEAENSPYTESGESGVKSVNGVLAFRLTLPNGTLALPDPNTPYYIKNGDRAYEARIGSGGMIDVWNRSPDVTSEFVVTPYFGGGTGLLREGNPKPEWGFTRVLTTVFPYPYIYDIKYTKDGGLMPAGRITDEEANITPVLPAKPPAATVPPGSGTPNVLDDKKKKTNPLPYILVGVLVIGAIVLYLRTKQD
jgi:hypothetical protein